jgi:hypothetical protein
VQDREDGVRARLIALDPPGGQSISTT